MMNLVGKEMTMHELDNEMVAYGCYSEGEFLDNEEVIDGGCISYSKQTDEYTSDIYCVVDFEVVDKANKEEESLACTIIKVTGI